MKNTFFFLLGILPTLLTAQTAKTWNVDAAHSSVKFSVSHLVLRDRRQLQNIFR